MKVLVTGATGGLGELVINELLKRNIEVIATSRDAEKAENQEFYNKVVYLPHDIHDKAGKNLYEYLQRPDALIHLAWEKLNEYKNPEHTGSILAAHKHFLSNLIENGLKDLTVTGTCYEYGLQDGIMSEENKPQPTLPYPIAKNMLREFLENISAGHSLNFKWLRIFYVFGEVKGRSNLYSSLMKAIENKEPVFNMSGGEQVRDFLSPQQIAEIIVKTALQKKVIGVINCCSGKPVKLKDKILDFLQQHNYHIELNLGYYSYPDYEPMVTWGSTAKLNKIIV